MTTYKIGDIVLIGFPHSDLKHIAKRPAIVLFDAGDEDILVARITTQGYTTRTETGHLGKKTCYQTLGDTGRARD
jgi:mRNA interferase MazF